jgi:aspartyl/asparaginyl beta-hydroxylase (cupin superfamily)
MKNLGVVVNGLFLWSTTRVVNVFFDLFTGGARRPAFFEVERVRPDLSNFDHHFSEIRQELEAILAHREEIPRYHDLDPLQRSISAVGDPDKRWQVFMLNCMGERIEKNAAQCPVTAAVVESMPDIFQAFFSILEGGKSIPAHSGIYRGYLRYHLALKVPNDKPPRIRVKDQFYQWREAESIVFDDSWEHQVYNESSDIRVVLIVDFLRPMPAAAQAVNRMFKAYLRLHYARFMLRRPYFQ